MINTDRTNQVESYLMAAEPELISLRRHFHQNPELSGREFRTTAELSERLALAGVPHRVTDSGRGLITELCPGDLHGAPTLAFRADLDALPIAEENDVPYRSRNPGIMHACGHDAHTAMLLTATLALHQAGPPFAAGWRSIFQPSEEVGQGAREIIDFGALAGVNAVIALHVDPTLERGQVGITAGPRTANCLDFVITVQGRGGHGARPHLTVDPIAVAAHLVTLCYQAIPRHIDVRQPVVLTIGQIQGGNAANVIPDTVDLKGTIRALHLSNIQVTRSFLERVCQGVAQTFGAKVEIVFGSLLAGVTNDPKVTRLCAQVATELFGSDRIVQDIPPSMGAEDFADYLQVVPGCMVTLGVKSPGQPVRPLHTSTFDLDESALLLGARLLARVLLHWHELHFVTNKHVN
jgi:amidohydrolase